MADFGVVTPTAIKPADYFGKAAEGFTTGLKAGKAYGDMKYRNTAEAYARGEVSFEDLQAAAAQTGDTKLMESLRKQQETKDYGTALADYDPNDPEATAKMYRAAPDREAQRNVQKTISDFDKNSKVALKRRSDSMMGQMQAGDWEGAAEELKQIYAGMTGGDEVNVSVAMVDGNPQLALLSEGARAQGRPPIMVNEENVRQFMSVWGGDPDGYKKQQLDMAKTRADIALKGAQAGYQGAASANQQAQALYKRELSRTGTQKATGLLTENQAGGLVAEVDKLIAEHDLFKPKANAPENIREVWQARKDALMRDRDHYARRMGEARKLAESRAGVGRPVIPPGPAPIKPGANGKGDTSRAAASPKGQPSLPPGVSKMTPMKLPGWYKSDTGQLYRLAAGTWMLDPRAGR